jgi:Putative peptidoglycan binding domain
MVVQDERKGGTMNQTEERIIIDIEELEPEPLPPVPDGDDEASQLERMGGVVTGTRLGHAGTARKKAGLKFAPYPGSPLRRGRHVRAVKRALWRAGVYRRPPHTGIWGPFAERALRKFQPAKGVKFGSYSADTHRRLARYMDDYALWLLTGTKAKTVDQLRREKIVMAAMLTWRKRDSITYTQGPRRMEGVRLGLKPPKYPRYMDCSAGATWLYYQAGAPDPNAEWVRDVSRNYDGQGYTGTLRRLGKRVGVFPNSRGVQVGDLGFYGPGPNYTHVVIAIGRDKVGRTIVWSMGSTPGPYLLGPDYRPDFREWRTYPMK